MLPRGPGNAADLSVYCAYGTLASTTAALKKLSDIKVSSATLAQRPSSMWGTQPCSPQSQPDTKLSTACLGIAACLCVLTLSQE